MKVIRRGDHPHELLTARPISHRNTFFFYEKNSGVAHFHVQAGPDGRLPVDQAAGLLAMHCLVRGQNPSDYAVLVQAESHLLENLIEKADQLLEAGKAVHGQVRLTRREEEVRHPHDAGHPLELAGKIPGARPHGAGSRSGSARHGGSVRPRARSHERCSFLCSSHKELPRAAAPCRRRSPGKTAIDGLI